MSNEAEVAPGVVMSEGVAQGPLALLARACSSDQSVSVEYGKRLCGTIQDLLFFFASAAFALLSLAALALAVARLALLLRLAAFDLARESERLCDLLLLFDLDLDLDLLLLLLSDLLLLRLLLWLLLLLLLDDEYFATDLAWAALDELENLAREADFDLARAVVAGLWLDVVFLVDLVTFLVVVFFLLEVFLVVFFVEVTFLLVDVDAFLVEVAAFFEVTVTAASSSSPGPAIMLASTLRITSSVYSRGE